MADLNQITLFLILAFGISLIAFLGVLKVPNAQTPETRNGLLIWLLMVWGPSLAAIIIAINQNKLPSLLNRVVQYESIPPIVWFLIITPIAMVFLLERFSNGDKEPLTAKVVIASIAFNMVLGPLGEELGWRGFMQQELSLSFGWLQSSLIVGIFWFLWHLPLWAIDSPQKDIPKTLFGAHCLCYSVIIGGAYTLSGGSILPAILLHLTFNLASNWAAYVGFSQADTWFKTSLPPYIGLSLFTIYVVGAPF